MNSGASQLSISACGHGSRACLPPSWILHKIPYRSSHLRYSALPHVQPFLARAAGGQSAGAHSPNVHRLELKSLIEKLKPPDEFGEEFMKMVAGATSAPIAQYIPSPTTALHRLDPRVKQAWLLALVFLPSRSHVAFRLGLVVFFGFGFHMVSSAEDVARPAGANGVPFRFPSANGLSWY